MCEHINQNYLCAEKFINPKALTVNSFHTCFPHSKQAHTSFDIGHLC